MPSSRRFRILFLSREYPPETGGGGIGSYVHTMAHALALRGHDVHVLSCVDGQVHQDRLDGLVQVHRRGVWRLLPRVRRRCPATALRLEGAVSRYVQYLRLRSNFDVVEAPDWFAEGLIFSLLGVRPLIVHLHTPLGIAERYNPGSFHWTRDRRFADRLERVPIRRADLVTSPSQLLADDIVAEGTIPEARSRIVRYPLDATPWAHLSPPDDAPPCVLTVGRLEGRKAPEVVVRAAALLAKQIPDFEAVFVGRSSLRNGRPYRDWLVELAASIDAPCRFVEEVRRDELGVVYASSRVVALASRYDNFPYVGLEAMASGRPVVCTEQTGTAELVRRSGAGAVVPVDDPAALADALRPFLVDPGAARRSGREAQAIVARECSPDRVAEQREECYAEAVARWRRRRVRTPSNADHRRRTLHGG